MKSKPYTFIPSRENLLYLSNLFAKYFYGHLCGYVHSGSNSVQQVWGCNTAEDQKTLCRATLKLIMITMANLIKSYSKIFPKSNNVFQQDQSAVKLIDMWIIIGKEMNGFIDDRR